LKKWKEREKQQESPPLYFFLGGKKKGGRKKRKGYFDRQGKRLSRRISDIISAYPHQDNRKKEGEKKERRARGEGMADPCEKIILSFISHQIWERF